MLFKQLIYLKQKQFTGKVDLQSSQNINWIFYFYLGIGMGRWRYSPQSFLAKTTR